MTRILPTRSRTGEPISCLSPRCRHEASAAELLGLCLWKHQSQISQSPPVLQPLPPGADRGRGQAESPGRAPALPRRGRGLLFSHRWPRRAACSQGTCTAKRQSLAGWSLAGWCSLIRLGTAVYPDTAPDDVNAVLRKRPATHCCDQLQPCARVAFPTSTAPASLTRKPYPCPPHCLWSLEGFSFL